MNINILKPSGITTVTKTFDALTKRWHTCPSHRVNDIILRLHHNNFLEWHAEDVSHNPASGEKAIVQAKKNIDRLNALRNNLIEQTDEFIYSSLPRRNKALPYNSETPASIIDRLSILSLRIYHMQLQAKKSKRYTGRLVLLLQQRADLAQALKELIRDLILCRKQLKTYRHFKIYQDRT